MEWWDDEDYADYGLRPEQIDDLGMWAVEWATSVSTRLQAEEDPGEL
ncbi:hypothetical protein [Streptomyces sp. SLBN-31]|nr:hypothetical protein [Streptomyces sp. SLBN-31]